MEKLIASGSRNTRNRIALQDRSNSDVEASPDPSRNGIAQPRQSDPLDTTQIHHCPTSSTSNNDDNNGDDSGADSGPDSGFGLTNVRWSRETYDVSRLVERNMFPVIAKADRCYYGHRDVDLVIGQILQVVSVIREIRITAAMLDDGGRPLSVPIDYPARVHCIESDEANTTDENKDSILLSDVIHRHSLPVNVMVDDDDDDDVFMPHHHQHHHLQSHQHLTLKGHRLTITGVRHHNFLIAIPISDGWLHRSSISIIPEQLNPTFRIALNAPGIDRVEWNDYCAMFSRAAMHFRFSLIKGFKGPIYDDWTDRRKPANKILSSGASGRQAANSMKQSITKNERDYKISTGTQGMNGLQQARFSSAAAARVNAASAHCSAFSSTGDLSGQPYHRPYRSCDTLLPCSASSEQSVLTSNINLGSLQQISSTDSLACVTSTDSLIPRNYKRPNRRTAKNQKKIAPHIYKGYSGTTSPSNSNIRADVIRADVIQICRYADLISVKQSTDLIGAVKQVEGSCQRPAEFNGRPRVSILPEQYMLSKTGRTPRPFNSCQNLTTVGLVKPGVSVEMVSGGCEIERREDGEAISGTDRSPTNVTMSISMDQISKNSPNKSSKMVKSNRFGGQTAESKAVDGTATTIELKTFRPIVDTGIDISGNRREHSMKKSTRVGLDLSEKTDKLNNDQSSQNCFQENRDEGSTSGQLCRHLDRKQYPHQKQLMNKMRNAENCLSDTTDDGYQTKESNGSSQETLAGNVEATCSVYYL